MLCILCSRHAVRGPELLSKWLGDSEKAVQSLFRRAREAAPCIVFFDEIDALAGKRGEASAGVNDRVLSQLLTELDGAQTGARGVVVVAATNRPDLLDAALLRPGRIDRKIYVPPPDLESRLQILRIELSKVPLDDEVTSSDLDILALQCNGFSGAEVAAVCQEAAMLAADRDAQGVARSDLEKAVSEIVPQITRKMLEFYETLALKYR